MSLTKADSQVLTVTATDVGLGNVTNESKATMFTDPAFTGTPTGVTATHVGLGNVTNESKATMFTNPAFTGTTTFQQFTEVFNTKSNATGTVTHDYSTGNIWFHTTPAANFTVDLVAVPTTNNRTIKIVIGIVQNAGTAFYPNAFLIDGVAQTIRWQFNQFPSPNTGKVEIATFLLVRADNAWTVLGHWNSY